MMNFMVGYIVTKFLTIAAIGCSMDETSLTIRESVKNRLEGHRHDSHGSWSEQLEGMMEMLPTIEEIYEDGCANCGEKPYHPDWPPEKNGGVIRFFHSEFEGQDVFVSTYFCSIECANETQEEIDRQFPEEPDLVVVGGKEQLRAESSDCSFYFTGDVMQITLSIPGAFEGYEDEPVFIKNADQWVQTGTVGQVIHEEAHTTLDLSQAVNSARLYHPDDETRQEAIESYCHWYKQTCPECGEELRVSEAMDETIKCGYCDSEIEREPVDEEELPEPVRDFRSITVQ